MAARSAARLAAVQALYQMDLASTDIEAVICEFVEERFGRALDDDTVYPDADAAHFEDLMRGVLREQVSLDRRINGALREGWSLDRIDSTLRAILRAGTYELQRCKKVPARVAVNEYVELANAFFDGDEPKVTNAVLDRVGRELRPDEFAGAPGKTAR